MILPVWSILLKRTSTLPHVHLDKINDLHSCFSGVRISTYVSKMSFEIRRKIVLSLPTFIVEPTLQATLVQTCSTTLRSMRSLTTPTSTTVHSDQNFTILSKNTLWPRYICYETPPKKGQQAFYCALSSNLGSPQQAQLNTATSEEP